MSKSDPIYDLLQSADAAADLPLAAAGLPERVRRSRAAKITRSRRIATATLATGTLFLISLFYRNHIPQISDQPIATNSEEIARIHAQADALSAEADALQNAISQQKDQLRLAELTQQYNDLLAERPVIDAACYAVDHAAAISICQGDFFSRELDSPGAAAEAYRSVVKHFPESRWAAIAHDKLSLLQMN